MATTWHENHALRVLNFTISMEHSLLISKNFLHYLTNDAMTRITPVHGSYNLQILSQHNHNLICQMVPSRREENVKIINAFSVSGQTLSALVVIKFTIFISPELKAQVSFSDQNLSVVRRCRRCRRCRCRCRRKLFTFSSSSPEPLGQFQPNLAQSILG